MVAPALKQAQRDRRRIGPVATTWAIGAYMFLCAEAAQAQPQDLREVEARKYCLVGNVQHGVELLAQLYVETENPNYIYNQARCYEQNGKPDEAILRFREYLRKLGNPSAEEKADVERHIAECQATKTEQSKETSSTSISPVAPPAVPVTEAAVPPPISSPPPATSASDAIEGRYSEIPTIARGATLRTAGIVTAAIGVAAVAAGIVFSLETRSIRDEVTSDNSRQTYDRNKDDRGRLFATLQWVGYCVGGAALAGGTVLYYLGHRSQHSSTSSTSLTLAPMISPDQAGAVLLGSY